MLGLGLSFVCLFVCLLCYLAFGWLFFSLVDVGGECKID